MDAGATYFDVLGLPQQYALEFADIEVNYLARSRATHPDFHQQELSSEQRAILEQSARLNEAYTTLRDPFKRAEYLLTLEGGPSASELREMDPGFLEEMLELRMEIEELRQTRDPAALELMEKQLHERRIRLIEQIGERFKETKSPASLMAVRQLLNTAKYIQGQLRDLRAD